MRLVVRGDDAARCTLLPRGMGASVPGDDGGGAIAGFDAGGTQERGWARVRRRRRGGRVRSGSRCRCVVGTRGEAAGQGARVCAWQCVGILMSGFLEDSGRRDGRARRSSRRVRLHSCVCRWRRRRDGPRPYLTPK